MSSPLVVVEDLKTVFPGTRVAGAIRRPDVRAVDGVSLSIDEGQTFSLVGESGCGKSTLGRSILRLVEPTSGDVTVAGQNVGAVRGAGLRALRRQMQMVFQDPFSALNPRMRIEDIVAEPLVVHRLARGNEARAEARRMLARCGIPEGSATKRPAEFSGGQRQRIVIARALVTRPRFIVADEPVSALDVSIQAQILNLLQELQAEFQLTYLFISHDLAVVKTISDRVAVMYLGKIVEESDPATFFRGPSHPYSQALLAAVPRDHPRDPVVRVPLTATPLSAGAPGGCRFHPRCPLATARCRETEPPLAQVAPGHRVACHLVEGQV